MFRQMQMSPITVFFPEFGLKVLDIELDVDWSLKHLRLLG
jgi:hypothetical protein